MSIDSTDGLGFELEFRTGGQVQFRGLHGCAVRGDHYYQIPAQEFEGLLQLFGATRFFGIPREDPRGRRVIHASAITITYRDKRRIHETIDIGRNDLRLRLLARRLREAGRIGRLTTPTAGLYYNLVQAGWNVNAVGEDGENALPCAVRAGDAEAARILLVSGATVSRSAWGAAFMPGRQHLVPLLDTLAPLDVDGPLAAHMFVAAARRAGPAFRYLLDRGVPVDAIDRYGESALVTSIQDTTLENFRLLLSAGADPSRSDRNGRAPLHHAALSLNTGFITLLLDRGARVDAADDLGQTPLMRAAEWCYSWSVRTLLEAGADPRRVAKDGKTAASLVRKDTADGKCRVTRELIASALASRPVGRESQPAATEPPRGSLAQPG
jgi:hypothetical protein